jgi:Domain of unknown function (DUF3883)
MLHPNSEILNLIGYGLAKFDKEFVTAFGAKTKQEFYKKMVDIGVAETIGTIKNRQDLFDPFFDNARKGWWQGKNYNYSNPIKISIDSLFGEEDVNSYSTIIKLYLHDNFQAEYEFSKPISPIIQSKFKQLQMTGKTAELFFINNYQNILTFKHGLLEDARMLGDGYDFQIEISEKNRFFLVEVKGVKEKSGSFRLTEKEYLKARDYQDDYVLVVVSNLSNKPLINPIFNPIKQLSFSKQETTQTQITFHANFKGSAE